MRRHLVLLLAVLTTVATATVTAAAPGRSSPGARPHVVVALADTGINPYHEVFRRPGMTTHPCRWLTGFTDCSIPALRLSIGEHEDHAAALAADREVWAAVEPGRWYWIPGTNIIGAVCDTERGGGITSTARGVGDPHCILDDNGHGTATASSVLSEAPDALLLIHDGKSDAKHLADPPVVPDVQSHSWGALVPLPLHLLDTATDNEGWCSLPARQPETLFFQAAGNEAPLPTVLDCVRRHPDLHVVGGASPGYWNYNSYSVYDFASWYCRPAAEDDSTTVVDDRKCGTSFSAPTAAGAAAAALQRIREHDGYTGRITRSKVSTSVTREAFVEALRTGASYTPQAKFTQPLGCTEASCLSGWAPLPPQAPYLFWGYGWLDSTVVDAVVGCALGRACPAKSAEAQDHNARRQELRRASDHDAFSSGPQSDAGSSRDAGDDRATAVPVVPGRTYDARLEAYTLRGDREDWFAFRAVAGQRISVSASTTLHPSLPGDTGALTGCWVLHDPEGEPIGRDREAIAVWTVGCDSTTSNPPPQQVRAPATGTYVLVYAAHHGTPPQDYRFTVSLEP